MTGYPDDVNDEIMQYLMDQLNKAYSAYKKDHPDFARIVETQCEGLSEQEFEAQFVKEKSTHCKSCGEWLDGSDQCPECGRINKHG